MSRRISGMSRCALTSPASHKRVRTIIARAIHTMPPLCLDADLIGLHLPQVTRLLDQMLLDGLPLDARARHPTRHRPLVEAKGDDDRLQRTAMGQQRHHQADRLRRGPQAVERRAFRGA